MGALNARIRIGRKGLWRAHRRRRLAEEARRLAPREERRLADENYAGETWASSTSSVPDAADQSARQPPARLE